MPIAGSQSQAPELHFYVSADLGFQVQLRVDRLLGYLPACRVTDGAAGDGGVPPSALCVEGRLCSYGEPLGIPARTAWAEAGTAGAAWDTWLAFPIKYRDLGHDAQLALTVWEARDGEARRPLGGTTLRLFSKKGRLKTGTQELQVWLGRAADGGWPSATPAKVPVAQRGELGRVEQVVKRYERGEVEHVDWLDRLAQRSIAELRARDAARRQAEAEVEAAGEGASYSMPASGGSNPAVAPGGIQLLVELPSFPRTVIYQQAAVPLHGGAPAGSLASGGTATTDAISTPLPGTSGAAGGGGGGVGAGGASSLILLHDAEVGRENPAEAKAAKLARSLTRGLVDKKLKPDTEERRRIEAVMDYPPNRPLSADDKALLWRFRYALTAFPRALTKFLKCVDWSDASEARQAAELMQQWAPIGVADALELLSPDFVNEEVRGHAVEVLQKTDDEELLYYLLQLVQALRYEAADDSRLAAFLVARGRRSLTVASFLFWYLLTELTDDSFCARAQIVQAAIVNANSGQQASPTEECVNHQMQLVIRLKHISETVSGMRGSASKKAEALRGLLSPGGMHADLAGFSCPCPLDPSVQLLGLVPSECSVFKSAMTPLRLTFRARLPGGSAVLPSPGGEGGSGSALQQSHEGRLASLTLASQHSLGGDGSSPGHGISTRRQSSQHFGSSGGGTTPRSAVASPHLTSADEAAGLVGSPGQLSPTSSARHDSLAAAQDLPLALVTMIYKRGDDLRQDQLVVQMISLMDRLLKREHLDLKITPYQVLATSCTDGLIEFVPSQPLARVLAENRSIHRFLAMHHPDPAGPFGLSSEVLATFVKSCAGYCVMTWLLGVGDRHLDNLMLTTDGRLFHIDFGYILGRDPKPFPPPMKLAKEMVDAMGGQDSEHYRQFKTYCCEAYNILRKSANLLLNLLHLMAGASIPDIQSDPEKAMLKLQEKLRPDLRDEEAALWMTQVLSDSATALMPQVMEKAHQWAQTWR